MPTWSASLSSLGKPALLATRVHIQHCYFHCARSIVRAKLWDPKAWPAPGRVSFGKIIAPRIGADAERGRRRSTPASRAPTRRGCGPTARRPMTGVTRRAFTGARAGAWRLLRPRAARGLAHADAGQPAHRHLFREPAVRIRVERPEDRLRSRPHERDRLAASRSRRCSSTRSGRRSCSRCRPASTTAIVGGITITPERAEDAGLVDALHDHDPQPRGRQGPLAARSAASPISGAASVGVQAATTDYDIAVRMQQKGQIGSVKGLSASTASRTPWSISPLAASRR